MPIPIKARVAKLSLVVAGALFFTGFLVLCTCPGWYGLAAAFAGAGVWAGAGRIRVWSVVCLAASLIMADVEILNATREDRRFAEKLRAVEQMRSHESNNSGRN